MSTTFRATRQLLVAFATLIAFGAMTLSGAEWRAFDNSMGKPLVRPVRLEEV